MATKGQDYPGDDMTRGNRFLKAVLSIMLGFGLLASLQAGQPAWPHEGPVDLSPDPAVTWGRLDNGLRYGIMPHPEPPDRVSLRLLVQAGSLMENPSQCGLAHFLEHMAFNGTKHFPADEMVEYFQRLGMAFGADTNAHTGFDQTVYKLQLPRNDPSLLEDGLKLLRDYADGMLLAPEELEKERGVILSEKRARDSVSYRTYLARMAFLFPKSLISRRHPIGLESVIKGASRDEFLAFYRQWYTPDRLVLVVAGEVEVEPLRQLIAKHFGSLTAPASRRGNPDLGEIPANGLRSQVHREPEASAVSVLVQTVKPLRPVPDSQAKRRDDLFGYAACSMISRRLEILAKEEGASFTSGSAFAYQWLDFLSTAGIQLTCKPEQWQGALGVAETELRRALNFGFTQGELNEIRANLLNYFEREVEKASTRKSGQLADDIVRAVNDREVYTSPQDDLHLARQVLAELTKPKALEALRRLWQDGPVNLFISGNLTSEVDEKAVAQAYAASRAEAVSPPVEAPEQGFAYGDFGEPGQVVSRREVEDLGVVQLVLNNHVRVNLKRTDFEANTIRVAVCFGAGGLTAPERAPGLSELAESTFVAGGLVDHSAEQIKRIFAGRNVGVDFGIDPDSFVLSGRTTPEDLASQLNLMCAYLTAPGYREEALRQARKQFEALYLTLRHTPRGVFRNQVTRFLAGGDFRFGFPDRDQLFARSLQEVRQWLAEPLAADYMEVSLVGDFQPQEVVRELCRTFGALPVRRQTKPEYAQQRRLSFPRNQRRRSFDCISKIPKAIAAVFWPTADIWDISRTRRLGVLAEVLSDRLRKHIREDIGETYSPEAFIRQSDTYKDYGYLGAIVIGDPQQADRLTDAVRTMARQLASEGISEDELQRALAPRLADLQEWVRNNTYWLNTVLARSQEYPVRLEWARTMQKDFASITVDDINRLARQYLPDPRSLAVTVLPREEATE